MVLIFSFILISELAVTVPPTVKSPVLALKVNAVAVVLMLGVWFPVPATNTG
jgi:hypothetical protein